MRVVFALAAALVVALLASPSGAIDAPLGSTDLRAGLDPLAEQFDSERGRHRLLLLLSPA